MKTYICTFCKKSFRQIKTHVYKCELALNSLSKDEKLLQQLCYQLNTSNLLEWINEKYVIEELSATEIIKDYNCSQYDLNFILRYYSISKRNISASKMTNRTQSKFKITCQERYGVDNPSCIEEVKNKKRQTSIKNYGVDNIFKDVKFKEDLSKHMHDAYGKGSMGNNVALQRYWASKTNEDKKLIFENLHLSAKEWYKNLSDEEKQKRKDDRRQWAILHSKLYGKSKLEENIGSILKEMGVEITPQYFVNRVSYDFRIDNTNYLIEVQGNFWHANPKIYSEHDIMKFPLNNRPKAKDIWLKDHKRKENAENYGYKVLYLWEDEINNNNKNIKEWLRLMLLSLED